MHISSKRPENKFYKHGGGELLVERKRWRATGPGGLVLSRRCHGGLTWILTTSYARGVRGVTHIVRWVRGRATTLHARVRVESPDRELVQTKEEAPQKANRAQKKNGTLQGPKGHNQTLTPTSTKRDTGDTGDTRDTGDTGPLTEQPEQASRRTQPAQTIDQARPNRLLVQTAFTRNYIYEEIEQGEGVYADPQLTQLHA